MKVADVVNVARALEELKERVSGPSGWPVTQIRHTLDEMDLTLPTALVLGAEGAGLRRLVREQLAITWIASIPLRGHVQSLNVSVAGLGLLCSRRSGSGMPEATTGGREFPLGRTLM